MVQTIAEASECRTEGISSKGTSGKTGTISTQAQVKAGWKNAESDESTAKPERGRPKMQHSRNVERLKRGTHLVLLQVNCRNICNKVL
jgi:hypothetical protein